MTRHLCAILALFALPAAASTTAYGPDSRYCGTHPFTVGQPECYEVDVTCPGIDPATVALRVTHPEGDALGTVVALSGGAGKSWYGQHAEAGRVLTELVDAGYRVVQRFWRFGGWVHGSVSLPDSGCRGAELLRWVQSQWGEAPICATGNSGGASELAYGLAYHGTGDVLTLAVLTSGPPHGAPDFGCGTHPDWAVRCAEEAAEMGVCGGQPLMCEYPPSKTRLIDNAYDLLGKAPCADGGASTLRRARPSEGALDYPNTQVRFLFGSEDCGEAPPLASVYVDGVVALSSGLVSVETIVGAGHALHASPAGADAIRDDVLEGCR